MHHFYAAQVYTEDTFEILFPGHKQPCPRRREETWLPHPCHVGLSRLLFVISVTPAS